MWVKTKTSYLTAKSNKVNDIQPPRFRHATRGQNEIFGGWVFLKLTDTNSLAALQAALFSLTHSVLISPDESKTFFLELKNNIKIYIIAHLRTEKNTTNHICSFKKHTHTHTLTKRHTDGASVPTGLGEVFIAVKKKKKSWEIVWVEQAESGSPGSGRCVFLILYKSQVLW